MPFQVIQESTGVEINDATPSLTTAYSGQKIENELALIVPGVQINDATPSLTTAYSGQKIENELALIVPGVQINDATPSLTTAYSGQKIEDELALLVTAANAPQLPQTTTAERVVVTTGTENVFEDSLKIYRETGNTINIGEHGESGRSTREESICIGLNSGCLGNPTHLKTCVGYQSCRGTSGNEITAFGFRSFQGSTGQRVTAIGHYAMAQCNLGDQAVAIGHFACQGVSNVMDSVAIGHYAGSGVSGTGLERCVALGPSAFRNASNTYDSLALGENAGFGASLGRSIGIGRSALSGASGTDNIAFGVNALGDGFGQPGAFSGNNKFVVGSNTNAGVTKPYILDCDTGTTDSVRVIRLNADSIYMGSSLPTSQPADDRLWLSNGSLSIGAVSGGGGSSTFIGLTDTPSSHSANGIVYSTGSALAFTNSQIAIDGNGVEVNQLNARVNNTSNIGDNSHKFDNVFCNAIHQGNVKLVLPTVPGNVNQILKVQSVNSEVHELVFADDNTSGSGGSGSSTFIGLTDTPPAITANQTIRGNSSGTALEFYTPGISDVTNLQSSLDGKLSTQVNTLGSGGTSLHIVSGQQLGLKRLNGGSNVTITENNGDIIISASGGSVTEVDDSQITSTTTYSSNKIVNDYFPLANLHGSFRSGSNEVYNAPYINTELGNKLSTSGGSLSGHVTTNQVTFTSNDQLVSKNYVDGSSAGKSLTSGTYDLGAGNISINQQDTTSITITGCPRPLSAYNAVAGSGNYYTPSFLNERIIPEVVSATNQYVLSNDGTSATWLSTLQAGANTVNIGTSTIKKFATWVSGTFLEYFMKATPNNGDTLGSVAFSDTTFNNYAIFSGKVDDNSTKAGHFSFQTAFNNSIVEKLLVGKSDHSGSDAGQFAGNVKVNGLRFSNNALQLLPVEPPPSAGLVLTSGANGTWSWQ